MNTRKRTASVAFPSAHSPNKAQRRLATSPSSSLPSLSATEGLLTRWFSLLRDTAFYVGRISSMASQATPPPIHASSNFTSESASSSSEDSSQPSSLNSEEVAVIRPLRQFPTPRPTPPLSSIRSAFSSRPSRTPILIGSQGVRKFTGRRPHIHWQLHQAQAKEKMKMELYNYERAQGYSADFQTFKTFLDYRHKVEQMMSNSSLHNTSRPVFSNTKGNGRVGNLPLEPINTTALQRALIRARDSLVGPGPAKPFIPTFEQLEIADKQKDRDIDRRIRAPLPEALAPDAQEFVSRVMADRQFVSKAGREQVAHKDLVRLRPGQWLNDELINFYGQLIVDRSLSSDVGKENMSTLLGGQGGKKRMRLLQVHYFNTFFWPKVEAGYAKSNLRKWTKKIDIFSKDAILIPINHNQTHWSAAVINITRKRIEAYDSLDPNNSRASMLFHKLREYLQAEHRDKKGKDFDFRGWEDYGRQDTPQQENGFDCGVFTTQFLETAARGEEGFSFSQKNTQYLRQRMIWEIGRGKLGENR